jgi:hypothetical protein
MCAGRRKIGATVPFVKITAVEGEHQGDVVDAAYDTEKLVFDRAVVWRRQPNRGPGDLEFERTEAAHVSIVLLWEHMGEARPMQSDIDKLQRFASVDSVLHRPPKVEVSWGNDAHAIPTFDGVIESLSIRYFGVADGGTPLHAAADVKLEQAVHLRAATQ